MQSLSHSVQLLSLGHAYWSHEGHRGQNGDLKVLDVGGAGDGSKATQSPGCPEKRRKED